MTTCAARRRRLGRPHRRPASPLVRRPRRTRGSRTAGSTSSSAVAEGERHDLVLEISRDPLPDAPRTRAGVGARPSGPGATRRARARGTRSPPATSASPTRCCAADQRAPAPWSRPRRPRCPSGRTQGRNYDYRYAWIRDQCYAGQAVAAVGGARRCSTPRSRSSPPGCSRTAPSCARRTPSTAGAVPDERPLRPARLPGRHRYASATTSTTSSSSTRFGEALLLFAAADRAGRLDGDRRRAVEVAVAAIEARHDEPDAGIWELEDRRWAHSRLMCAAGLRAAGDRRGGRTGAEWAALADRLVAYGRPRLPAPRRPLAARPRTTRASTPPCCCPAIRGAVPPDDPRAVATIARRGRRSSPTTATSTASARTPARRCTRPRARSCSAASTSRWPRSAGRRRRRRCAGSSATAARCGPPGLFTEEYDVVQRQLRGNLPQAFVHALLLETAQRLGEPASARRASAPGPADRLPTSPRRSLHERPHQSPRRRHHRRVRRHRPRQRPPVRGARRPRRAARPRHRRPRRRGPRGPRARRHRAGDQRRHRRRRGPRAGGGPRRGRARLHRRLGQRRVHLGVRPLHGHRARRVPAGHRGDLPRLRQRHPRRPAADAARATAGSSCRWARRWPTAASRCSPPTAAPSTRCGASTSRC